MVPLDRILPPACVGCGAILRSRGPEPPVCDRCEVESPAFVPDERTAGGVVALRPLVGPLAEAYARYKVAGDLVLLPGFARLLAAHPALRRPGAHEALVPVPAYPLRTLLRGFDPAGALVRAAADLAPAAPPVRPLLRRTRWIGPRQRGASAQARAENVRGAFAVPEGLRGQVAGRRLLLADDVVTTGATLRAARRALLDAGAARVDRLALFRADG